MHDLVEVVTVLGGLTNLLEFADRFVEQAHLAESDSQVVMGFGIFIGTGDICFKFVLQVPEQV